jgi:predicted secreted hydrolase
MLLAAGCSPGGRVLGIDPTSPPPPATASPTQPPPEDPTPVSLPRDDGPHDRLTEWWYYTGHLRSGDGRRFGFEFVIFRAERGEFPVAWASHLAVTDEAGGAFAYDQRTEIGPQVDRGAVNGFDLAIRSSDFEGVPLPVEPWTLRGSGGVDGLRAESSAAGIGLDLRLEGGGRQPVLHDGDGWIDFGAGGSSYYYSRTRLSARGTLTLAGERLEVAGSAWFDHQWGDFVTVGGAGWDWFAVNLHDGTDLTLSYVRDRDGEYPLVYGTLVRADGSFEHLTRDAFSVDVLGEWTSPSTGAIYPAGWRIHLPSERLTVTLRPTVDDQELDTRATTGVVYWEGSQVVTARRAGRDLGGEAYVELTGYGPAGLPPMPARPEPTAPTVP